MGVCALRNRSASSSEDSAANSSDGAIAGPPVAGPPVAGQSSLSRRFLPEEHFRPPDLQSFGFGFGQVGARSAGGGFCTRVRCVLSGASWLPVDLTDCRGIWRHSKGCSRCLTARRWVPLSTSRSGLAEDSSPLASARRCRGRQVGPMFMDFADFMKGSPLCPPVPDRHHEAGVVPTDNS